MPNRQASRKEALFKITTMKNIANHENGVKPLIRRGLRRPLNHIPAFMKNKYLISFAAFCIIVLFLDKNDFFTQLDRRKELRDLQQSKRYFTNQLTIERNELEALKTNPATVEKYAREKYLMKRDNEELFIISEKPTNTKN